MIPIKDINPVRITPFVNWTLIAACILIFFWQVSLGPDGMLAALHAFGMIPAVLFGEAQLAPDLRMVPAPLTLITSMFLHGGWMHLIGNMLYLWVFGNNIEDRLGHARYLGFYIGCGLVAAISQIVPEPYSTTPMVGASGAISGVLGAYLVFYPTARVVVLIPLFFVFFLHELRAGWLLLIWFAFQILSALAAPSSGGVVAWWAHIGGFVAGMVVALAVARRSRRRYRGPWGPA